MTIQVDIAILGGGPGGYTAAIKAAKAGKSVAIVEQDKLGGTCLHKGCIPTKSLLHSAEVYRHLFSLAASGIRASVDLSEFNITDVQDVKQQKVEVLHKGLQGLMKKNGIQFIHGRGRVVGPSIFSPRSGSIAVELEDGEMETVVSEHLVIATGSLPREIEGLAVDGTTILTSDHVLTLEQLPKSMLIVGGGVIGIELASLLHDFGVDITVLEQGNRILPGEDSEISLEMSKLLTKRGIRIFTGAQLDYSTLSKQNDGIVIKAETSEEIVTIDAEKIVVAVGRAANCHTIGLENTDVSIKNNAIAVNEYGQTSEPHIYAIGDVTGGLQLAHVASYEAGLAIDHILGNKPFVVSTKQMPRCVYSYPQVAAYGLTEAEAIKEGYEIKKVKLPFSAIGKAIVSGETAGFVKVIANKANQDILGVHIIGQQATELISEAVVAGWMNAAPFEIGQTVHAHPTLSEAIMEAMLAVDGQSINY